jgi:hypothetical protein
MSMIGDYYHDKWYPTPTPEIPNIGVPYPLPPTPNVTKEEFEALRRDVLEMKELLKRALDYDKRNNEPHCETHAKMEVLRNVAKIVGISLDDIIEYK